MNVIDVISNGLVKLQVLVVVLIKNVDLLIGIKKELDN
jgi:hypothetical protein